PKENKKLAEEILAHEKGCILTEFPIGSEPAAWHFPMRNRIISGLSQGVVIVQAARKSGAYITVETALEQGRDVFAVPGELYNPLSEGPHQLLKEGAQMITCAEDVFASYGIHKEAKKKSRKSNKSETKNENNAKSEEQQMTLFQAPPTPDVPLTSEEERVLGLFTTEPLSIEEAAYLAKLPMSELMAILSMLELYGLIEPMVGRKYIRIG
ncbi:MAG: DNA-processing protein DprA, partial [Peptococcaceae bacterium]|nr:DNA-processing protein DprA [Peptococcaceae bacterium]